MTGILFLAHCTLKTNSFNSRRNALYSQLSISWPFHCSMKPNITTLTLSNLPAADELDKGRSNYELISSTESFLRNSSLKNTEICIPQPKHCASILEPLASLLTSLAITHICSVCAFLGISIINCTLVPTDMHAQTLIATSELLLYCLRV